MREFLARALKKLNKLTAEQITDLLVSAAGEIERLESVLDSLAEGILVCDTNHSIVMVNKRAERYLPAIHQHEQESIPVWFFVDDDRLRPFLEDTLRAGDRVAGREFDVDLAGKTRLLSVSVLPLVRDRQVQGSLIHVEDITERRGKEAQLRRAENLASLTTLAAGVAHEIKNPLGSLSIHVQLIQRAIAAMSTPELSGAEEHTDWFSALNHYIGVVNEEIARLNHIVVDFLFAVRPMDLELREGDVNGVIADLMDFVRYELEEAHIQAVLELAGDVPRFAFDDRYLKQALLNLVKNAIAAMPGGGSLTVKTEYADGEYADGAVVITVTDSGTGISETNLSRIFEPYFTTRESGSGLGLTLVFKIIREHRGDVTVRSREGAGASFIITLPVPQKETRLIAFDGAKSPAAAALETDPLPAPETAEETTGRRA